MTFGDDTESDGTWSPDGMRFAFQRRDGERGIYVRDVDGGVEKRLTDTLSGLSRRGLPTDDTCSLSFDGDLTLLTVDGAGKPITVASRNSRHGRFSSDGKYIAFTSSESGRDEVYVQAMPPDKRRQKISIDGGSEPRWSRDSNELFFLSPDHAMMAVDVKAGDAFSVGVPRELFPSPEPGLGARLRRPSRRSAVSYRGTRDIGN